MPHPDHPTARGHLRLAGAPLEARRPESRPLLVLRSLAATVALALLTVRAWIAAALALAPIAWRRAPVGARLRPFRPREARVIPFQPRQQKALPR